MYGKDIIGKVNKQITNLENIMVMQVRRFVKKTYEEFFTNVKQRQLPNKQWPRHINSHFVKEQM